MNVKRQSTGWKKIFANHIAEKDLYSEYMKNNSCNPLIKQNTKLKNEQKILVDISPKKDIQIANKHIRCSK